MLSLIIRKAKGTNDYNREGSQEVNVAGSISQMVQTTPLLTPTRARQKARASPGDVGRGGFKKHKDAPVIGLKSSAKEKENQALKAGPINGASVMEKCPWS